MQKVLTLLGQICSRMSFISNSWGYLFTVNLTFAQRSRRQLIHVVVSTATNQSRGLAGNLSSSQSRRIFDVEIENARVSGPRKDVITRPMTAKSDEELCQCQINRGQGSLFFSTLTPRNL